MSGINKVILVGHLGNDPELFNAGEGRQGCRLSLATSRTYTDGDGVRQERTEWHRVVCWGKQADLCAAYLGKGRQVFVEGALQTRKYVDKEGVQRYSTSIHANTVQFLGGKGEGKGGNGRVHEPMAPMDSVDPMAGDDIPF